MRRRLPRDVVRRLEKLESRVPDKKKIEQKADKMFDYLVMMENSVPDKGKKRKPIPKDEREKYIEVQTRYITEATELL